MEQLQIPFFLTLCVSTALGFLSGLGVGGGSLLILWLTLVVKLDYTAVKFINLLFFLPPALISTTINLLRKQIPIKKVFPAALAGSVSAIILTTLSSSWDVAILRKLFGALLLFAAWRELKYKSKQQSNLPK